jgi:hypothetical protein
LSFERNQGQADARVVFLSRGAGYTFFAADREAVLDLLKTAPEHTDPDRLDRTRSGGRQRAVIEADEIRMQFVGASNKMRLTGEDPLPGTVNYFLGNDSAKWHTGIPTFGHVQYCGVYPGIDLLYYGSPSRLEFDFQLAPGASASSIRLHFAGAKGIELERNGNLAVFAEHGRIGFRKPLIYQLDSGNTKHLVEGRFRKFHDGTVGFELGRYDRTRSLVIDPILDYSTYLGFVSAIEGIAVDSAGEAYVTGTVSSASNGGVPTTTGSYQPSFPAAGKSDPVPVGKSGLVFAAAFVAKFNSAGTALLYCTYLSGSENDAANAIAVDAAGDAYVAGATASTDFPVTTGSFQTSNHAGKFGTGFVTELNSSGSGLIYSTFLGGSQEASINGITIDNSGNAFVAGFTTDLDFPVTPGAFQSTSPANPIVGETGFVTKLAAGGRKLLYSTYLGGSKWDQPNGIAIDPTGNAYIAGGTRSPDFPITPGAFQSMNKTTIFDFEGGGFVSKLNPSGTALVYSTYLNGSFLDTAYAIAVDAETNAYVTGFATSSDFPTTPGVFQPSLALSLYDIELLEMSNVFITKLNPAGSGLVYSTFLGGDESYNPFPYGDSGYSIAVDNSGNAYIAGSTEDIDFPLSATPLQSQNIAQLVSGGLAGFVTKINPTASQILYSTYLTGSGSQESEFSLGWVNGVALDGSQNVYAAGFTASTDFPTTLGAFQTQSVSASYTGDAAFVTKFDNTEMQQLPLTTTTVAASPNPQMNGQPVTFIATVRSSSGNTPTGTVGFTYLGLFPGGAPYAFGPWNTVSLDATGTGTFTTSSLASGPISVVAYYLGDAENSPSYGSATETVNQIPTTAAVTANTPSAPYGTPITFTATVLETSSGKPAQGSVYFISGGIVYQTSALNSAGQATWSSGTGGPALAIGSEETTVEFFTLKGSPDQASQASTSVTITALGATAAPTFSPAAGTYSTTLYVTLSCATNGAAIYYTTDGSTPTVGSLEYLAGLPILVSTSQTVQAIAIAPGDSASPVVAAAYQISLPAPDFSLTASPATFAVTAGQSGTTTVTVTPTHGFNSAVSFSCSGLPTGASCSFSPATVTPSGAAASTMLTVSTLTTTGALHRPTSPLFPTAALAAVICFLGWKRRCRLQSLLLLAVALAGLGLVSGCGGSSGGGGGGNGGGGGGGGSTPITSTVTVAATSGSLQHTTTFTLTVD